MNIKVLNKNILDFAGDLVVANLFQGVKKPGGVTGALDTTMGGAISRVIESGEITGKLGETAVIHTLGRIRAKKILVVGLGPATGFGPVEVRKAAGAAGLIAKRLRIKTVATFAFGAGIAGIDPETAGRATTEGFALALYEFAAYKRPPLPPIEELFVYEKDRNKFTAVSAGVRLGAELARAQNQSRDLSSEPANRLTPQIFGAKVASIIRESGLTGKLKCRIADRRALERLKMGALLSVSRGSVNGPRFIILEYRNSRQPLLCLIGKTVTFDSGGISLKPHEGMSRMKGDMSGGGVVFATMLALARTAERVNVMALLPAVENMPSGTASRPGDVVRAMNGTTIEIISTDAEGRMTLADALCYAEKKGAKTIVDIATLTGGSAVAFGDVTAAVMGNDQRLIEKLLGISAETGERMWELPLFSEYEEKVKSDIADLKNSGGPYGSPITAGVFLKAFIKKARWIHIDIAGKEFSDRESFYQPKSATGFGVRTLYEFCRRV